MKFKGLKWAVSVGVPVLLIGWMRTPVGAQPPDVQAAGPLRQAMVHCDWILLPHGEANRLLRLPPGVESSGDALHGEALKLVREGKGKILHQQQMNVAGGLKTALNDVQDFVYPTEFDSPWMSRKVTVQGAQVVEGDVRPVAPSAFQTRQLGYALELETAIADDLWHVDFNAAVTWTSHVDDMTWGQGLAKVVMPVVHKCANFSQVLCRHGEWKLLTVVRPAAPGPEVAAQAFANERVLVFLRPVLEKPGAPPQDDASSAVSEVKVLMEWFEMDSNLADGLMDGIPSSGRTDAMRAQVQKLLDTGKAALLETAFTVVRGGQKSKSESVLEFPYPTEFDSPGMPESITRLAEVVPALPVTKPVFWPTPAVAQSFEFRNLGTSAEIEATVDDNRISIDLNAAPSLSWIAGFRAWGLGASRILQPQFAHISTASQVLLRQWQPVLWGVYDAMPPASLKEMPGRAVAGNPGRRILLFVTARL